MYERLVDVYGSYSAPDHVMADLRAIDPRTELVYVQRGKWWLGLVYTNIPLIHDGRRELCRIKDEGGAPWVGLRLALLKSQGFRRVILPHERWSREPLWAFMVHWFRKQDWIYRHMSTSVIGEKSEFNRHVAAMDGSNNTEGVRNRIVDLLHSDRRSLFRHVQGNPFVGYH